MAMQFQKFRMLLVVLAAFMVGGTIFASSAFAGICPTCQVIRATATTTTSSSSNSTTTTKIVVKKSLKEQVKQYQQVHHVVVAINQGRPISGSGCIDPVRLGLIRVGGVYFNASYSHVEFPDRWRRGRKLCNPHRVRHANGSVWLRGAKDDCHNSPVEIEIHGPPLPPPTKTVVTFRTVKTFEVTYLKWVKKSSSSHSTTTTSTTYSCQPGWALEGMFCKNCPPCPPQPPPPTKPTLTVDTMQEIDTSDFSVYPSITSTAPARSHVTAPVGDRLQVTFSSNRGSWPQGSVVTVTSSGTTTVTNTYQAPTEVGVDQVGVKVLDLTTNQTSDTEYSNVFDVVDPTPNP